MYSDYQIDRLDLEVQRMVAAFHSSHQEGLRLKEDLMCTLSARSAGNLLGSSIDQEYRRVSQNLVFKMSSTILQLHGVIGQLEVFSRDLERLEKETAEDHRVLHAGANVIEFDLLDSMDRVVADDMEFLRNLRTEMEAAVEDARSRLARFSREVEGLVSGIPEISSIFVANCHA